MRSAILTRLWRLAAPLVRGESAPRTLLALRLLNVLVFALVVGAAVALALTLVAEPFPQWLAYPFLFVPALPFFAMHVSETAVLCSVYVLLATSLAVIVLDGPRAHWAGLSLGLAHRPDARGRAVTVAAHGARRHRAARASRARDEGIASRHALGARLLGWFGLGATVFFVVLDDPTAG